MMHTFCGHRKEPPMSRQSASDSFKQLKSMKTNNHQIYIKRGQYDLQHNSGRAQGLCRYYYFEYSNEKFATLCITEDTQEGVNAFLEKRKPVWKKK